jgi:L-fuconolactonase
MTQQIDAHQHFWQIARGDYEWMSDAVAAIRHDTLPADLAPHLRAHGISGTVVVQAAATVAETEFLLGLATETPFIKGIVGWVDLASPDAPDTLHRLAKHSKFKGIRPMLQDIAETDWVLRPEIQSNLQHLARLGLRLDALIQPRHLPTLLTLAEAHPTLPIVIDHCAKPLIAGGADAGDEWRSGMARLAALPNLYCKLSGLAIEAGPGWSADSLAPIAAHILTHFGPKRVIWGSDWPVLNLVGDYDQWRAVTAELLAPLAPVDRTQVLGGTAQRFYGLDATP